MSGEALSTSRRRHGVCAFVRAVMSDQCVCMPGHLSGLSASSALMPHLRCPRAHLPVRHPRGDVLSALLVVLPPQLPRDEPVSCVREVRRLRLCVGKVRVSGAVLCCAVLCCAVLCCAVLCCAVLCCAVLCCVEARSCVVVFVIDAPQQVTHGNTAVHHMVYCSEPLEETHLVVADGDTSAAADGTSDILGWNDGAADATGARVALGRDDSDGDDDVDDDDGYGDGAVGEVGSLEETATSAHTAARSVDSAVKTPMRSYFAGDGSGQHSAKTVRRRTASTSDSSSSSS